MKFQRVFGDPRMGFAVGVNEREGLTESLSSTSCLCEPLFPSLTHRVLFRIKEGSKARKGQTLEARCDLLFAN